MLIEYTRVTIQNYGIVNQTIKKVKTFIIINLQIKSGFNNQRGHRIKLELRPELPHFSRVVLVCHNFPDNSR